MTEKIIKALPERPLWWLDPLFESAEGVSGVAKEDWTAAVGSQLVAAVAELPIEYFTTALGGKLINGVIGAGALGLAFSRAVTARGALETIVLGGHFLTEVLDPRPETVKEIFGNIANLQEGIREGNPTRVIDSFLKTGREEEIIEAEEVPGEEIPITETEEVPLGEEIPITETEEVPLGEEGGYTPVTEESESTEETPPATEGEKEGVTEESESTEETPPATEGEKEGGYTPMTAEITEQIAEL